ncbi:hypothetical protein DFH06DRAFT_1333651 [Mycena polygramma]|nr:hypothetical protein DFH06DRAFT_1333651 [Mycena polygramma]
MTPFLQDTPCMILSLPLEILHAIGAQASHPDRESLRAVCRTVALAINPLFFSSVTLDIHNRGRVDESHCFLEALASGETGWSRFARKLTIARLSPGGEWIKKEEFDEVQRAHVRMEKFLRPALESLKNVRSVIWMLNGSNPEWTTVVILGALCSLSFLDDLHLRLNSRTDLNGLHGLSRLRLRKIRLTASNAFGCVHNVTGLWNTESDIHPTTDSFPKCDQKSGRKDAKRLNHPSAELDGDEWAWGSEPASVQAGKTVR